MRLVSILAATCIVLPPLAANEFGQRVNCADWVMLESGLTCSVYLPHRCEDTASANSVCDLGFRGLVLDNDGWFYFVEMQPGGGPECGDRKADRLRLMRMNADGVQAVAYVDDRCGPAADACHHQVRPNDVTNKHRPAVLRFDPAAGRLFVSLRLSPGPLGTGDGCVSYEPGQEIVVLDGFTAMTDIIRRQTGFSAR